jgi:glutamate 5-kinase
MKIVVKVGTQSILSSEGNPLESVLFDLVEQIITLQDSGNQIVLVSSGAVGFGRGAARKTLGREYGSSIGEKQVLASLGQHELMNVYARLFKKHNILASQLLLTKQDFHTRKHYLNIARLLSELLEHHNIIPVINENDSVAIEELMFTDNDELAGLIAAQINADKLIILSNVEGVYTGHPNDEGSELIKTIDPKKGWPQISSNKSTHGRGGMISKISTAKKMSGLGITTHIASVNQPQVLLKIIGGAELGTKILSSKKQSNIKRWIAFNSEHTNGFIIINKPLYEILQDNKRVLSILPVGIESCKGDFKRGDTIDIYSPDMQHIGIGLARYDSNKLTDLCGQKNKPVFVHYDHLHIFTGIQ